MLVQSYWLSDLHDDARSNTPRIRLSNESATAHHVRCRSENGERVIDDEAEIVAAASSVTEINVAVAQPDPHAAQGRKVKIFELAFPPKVMLLSSPPLRLVFRPTITHTQHQEGRPRLRGATMDWKHLLASITGTVDQELLLRNEYLVTENRILRNQINGRVRLSDGERKALAE